ncbi:unnamed protein product, partial [Anisakis simplex]|uniref:G domain-containing protein n=1 Tax=Anisakis simplex TaxID=6269 RepID=A0A0M3JTN9_ANISI
VGYVADVTLILPYQRIVSQYGQHKNIRKVVIGGEQENSIGDRVILLFGSKGAGKTSVIDSMLNFLYDVKRENNFRFTLRAENGAPTVILTEYVINNSILPFSIAIVDTPGVIDENGYKGTSTIIREWFEEELSTTGRFRLDVISLVLKSDEEELGWPYIRELAEVKRMFGDDLKTNVLPIVTHTEVLPQPLAVHALAYANVTFLEYYKINNVAFIPSSSTIMNKAKLKRLFIDGNTSLNRYFTDLQDLSVPMILAMNSSDTSSETTVPSTKSS